MNKIKSCIFVALMYFCLNNVEGALQFNGIDDYVNCGNDPSLNITDAITIEAWVKKESAGTLDGIVDKAAAASSGYEFYVHAASKLRFKGYPNIFSVDANNAISIGEWHHVTAVYDRIKAYIYIDGVEDNSVSASNSISPNDNALHIGYRSYPGYSYYFGGTIDEVRIWKRALGASEIKDAYHSRGTDDLVRDLVGWWRMNEKSNGTVASGSNTVIDLSGNGNHGTQFGGPIYRPSFLKLFRRRP